MMDGPQPPRPRPPGAPYGAVQGGPVPVAPGARPPQPGMGMPIGQPQGIGQPGGPPRPIQPGMAPQQPGQPQQRPAPMPMQPRPAGTFTGQPPMPSGATQTQGGGVPPQGSLARASTAPVGPTTGFPPAQRPPPGGAMPRPIAPGPGPAGPGQPPAPYANGYPQQQPAQQQFQQQQPQMPPAPIQTGYTSQPQMGQLNSQMSAMSFGPDAYGQPGMSGMAGAGMPGASPPLMGVGVGGGISPNMGQPGIQPVAGGMGSVGAPRPSSRPKRVYAGAATASAAAAPIGGAVAGLSAPATGQFPQQQQQSGVGMPFPGQQLQGQGPANGLLPGAATPPMPGAPAAMNNMSMNMNMGMPPPPLPGMTMPQPQQPPLYTQPPQPTVSPLQTAQMIAASQPSGAAPPQPLGPRPGISPKSAAPANAPRPRIDPNQIPSPIAVHELDQKTHEGQIWSTASRTLPPLTSTDVRISDDGNASPRFMRITTYNIPATEELCNMSHLPLGLIVQPFAEQRYDEEPVQLVDFGENGPVRCHRCRGYINSGVKFVEGGRRWTCNLCDFPNEVPPEYFANLDMTGRRMDHDQRPELRYGTVEFVPTKEYFSRPAKPAAYVFALDVSWSAVQSGMLARVCSTLKGFLYEGEGLPQGCEVGIITYDRTVHFYNLTSTLDQAHMMVVADVMDVFAPLNEGFLADPVKSRGIIEGLLDSLPGMFEGNRLNEPVVGAVVEAALAALKARGGKLSLFQTALPTNGPHALKNREDLKLLNSDKEKQLYEPQEASWKKMSTQLAESGVSVDLYVFPSSYVDVATVGLLSAMTGGNTFMYPTYDDNRDGFKFANDFVRTLQRPFAFDAVLRVRSSNGLRVAEHHGNFYMKNSTDLEFAGIDSAKAFAITLKYDSKLDEKVESAFQCAMLYTSATGERRIRVSTLSVPSSTVMANIFRMADMDTSINYFSKTGISMTASYPLRTIRDEFTVKCTKILAAYRKHCGSSTAPGQLILPESFKLYPLYTLALLKFRAFRGGQEIPSDSRVFSFRTLKSMGVPTSVPMIYPRLFAVHEMPENAGQYSETGRFVLPPMMRVALERMEVDGAYILENGYQMFLWIGRQITPDFLRDVFAVDTIEQVSTQLRTLPDLDNPRSKTIAAIIGHIQRQRVNFLQLQIVRHQMDPFLEIEFNNLLVEDKNLDQPTYVDFLCNVHRQIQIELSNS